jgi:transcriptional regulator with XRE-family HTH domain
MTNAELRIIRQRLGWSTAEMARRLGENSARVAAFEAGDQAPAPEVLNQYYFLRNGVEEDAAWVAETPRAEAHLEAAGLAQVTNREILNDL